MIEQTEIKPRVETTDPKTGKISVLDERHPVTIMAIPMISSRLMRDKAAAEVARLEERLPEFEKVARDREHPFCDMAEHALRDVLFSLKIARERLKSDEIAIATNEQRLIDKIAQYGMGERKINVTHTGGEPKMSAEARAETAAFVAAEIAAAEAVETKTTGETDEPA